MLVNLESAFDCFGEEQWNCQLYEANKIGNTLNAITFFIADDTIDLADLQRYQKETRTERLIAINTTGKDYQCLNIADSVIFCSPDEIELAIEGLAFMVFGAGFIGVDWNDIKKLMTNKQPLQFIKSYAIGKDCWPIASEKLLSELQATRGEHVLTDMMVNTFTDGSFDFDKYDILAQTLEGYLNDDECNIFYQAYLFEEFEYWKNGEQGCCICAYLVFSDDEKDLKNKSL